MLPSMNIDDLLKNRKIKTDRLIPFGFHENENGYIYSTDLGLQFALTFLLYLQIFSEIINKNVYKKIHRQTFIGVENFGKVDRINIYPIYAVSKLNG